MDEKPYAIEASDEDFYLEEKDLVKYQAIIEDPRKAPELRPRFDSVASMEEYDLDGASKEVDDFLADISDEDEDGQEEEEEEEIKEDEPKKDTFILDLYKKRRANDDIDSLAKKAKQNPDTLDDLEQELMDGFDDLE